MSDVKAAAERLRDWNTNIGNPGHLDRTIKDAPLVAAWALPLLDETPADLDWWKSCGARQLFDDDQNLYITKEVGYDCHENGIGTENLIGWVARSTFDDEAASLGALGDGDSSRVATRGDVRRLCGALGISLREEA